MAPDTRAQTVCLLPHPDDEFAIFAEIEALVAQGRRVVCVYLTNGAFGGQSWERRMAESRAVVRALGVADDDVHFPGCDLGILDGTLHTRIPDAHAAARHIIARGAPLPRILLPAWEGGHQDHDAAHLIGLMLAREHATLDEALQFSLYHGRGLPGPLFRVMSPLAENGPLVQRALPWRDRARYLRYCLAYPSQWKTWVGLFPMVLAHYVLVGHERLQPITRVRVLAPPHAGRPLYERRGFCTWAAFAAATREIRASLAASLPN